MEKALERISELEQELAEFLKAGKWRSVPGMPALEVREDGRAARSVRPVTAQRDGYTVAQVENRRVRARLCDLHRAAWPELYPEGAAPAVEVVTKNLRPFKEMRSAPTGGLGRSDRIPALAMFDADGKRMDLDYALIDEEGYFVDRAGKRVFERVPANPADDE
jgi:hypothetical protein